MDQKLKWVSLAMESEAGLDSVRLSLLNKTKPARYARACMIVWVEDRQKDRQISNCRKGTLIPNVS